jgi:hypothetical protein
MKNRRPTHERLLELLHYNKSTGIFTRRTRLAGRYDVGDVAGGLNEDGYVCIRVDGSSPIRAHMLAIFYVTGVWPTQVDHRDGVRSNNKYRNLRPATNTINAQNLRKCRRDNKSTGILGVHPHGSKYRARIMVDNKAIHLGTFKTKRAAKAAYIAHKRQLHEGNTL